MVAERFVTLLQEYGVLDFLLPFILVFTIVFAILQKTNILGAKKNFNVIIALVLGLLFVVPHIIGSYPLGYDPVIILNQTLPSIALVAVASVMVLILMGLFGTGFADTGKMIVGLVALVFVVYIFGASLNLWRGPYDIFYWWTSEVTELLIVLAVFGLVISFITKEDNQGVKLKDIGEGAEKFLSKIIKKE
ncbi:hypothetical protein HYX13_04275 [Candidatus Woesearchaeota archaeon]|nr:hypothetical protein [Candidatus Woesearchaeota archaeon]